MKRGDPQAFAEIAQQNGLESCLQRSDLSRCPAR
jgi:hypothetical protein